MLLLDGTKLVVVASGYGESYAKSRKHVIDAYFGTKLLVYDVTDIGGNVNNSTVLETPLAAKDVHGGFVSLRAIQGNVHVVTSTQLSSYDWIVRPFEKWSDNELMVMKPKDYTATVVKRANEKYIPEFVERFMNDLKIDGKLPAFAKINNWDSGKGSSLAPRLYPNGYLQNVALIYSFDIVAIAKAKDFLFQYCFQGWQNSRCS